MRALAILAALLFAWLPNLKAACHQPPKPRIEFVGTLTGCSQGAGTCGATEPINFFAKTADGSSFAACDKFDWDFGDRSPHSSLMNPTHTFVSPGSFTVVLQVSNESGVDGVGMLVPVAATAFPTVVFFKVSSSSVGVGRTVVFSWSTTNAPKGIRIENVRAASAPAVVKLTSPLPVGSMSFTPLTTMSYTLTALGDASSYTTPTPLVVTLVGPTRARAVRH